MQATGLGDLAVSARVRFFVIILSLVLAVATTVAAVEVMSADMNHGGEFPPGYFAGVRFAMLHTWLGRVVVFIVIAGLASRVWCRFGTRTSVR